MAQVESQDGVKLYYEHHQAAGGETRGTILFSCAYCTTHENWRGQVEPLVAAGLAVVLWDLRGHGLSESPTAADAYSMDRVVADLDAVADATSPDQPIVAAGLSFGGLASLHYAKRHRDRVRALGLFGSGPGFKKPQRPPRGPRSPSGPPATSRSAAFRPSSRERRARPASVAIPSSPPPRPPHARSSPRMSPASLASAARSRGSRRA